MDDLTPEELARAMEESVKDFKDGDLVQGHVVRIDPDEILVDIGYKSEGVIPTKELSIRHDVDPNEEVSIGDEIEALILTMEDKEGRLILSKKRAQYERAWGRIEEVMNEGRTITGPVIEVVKGGLILDIGLRGFLPASLVDLRRVRDLHPFVGQPLECKIIELDRNRNNVVLSRRAHLEESQSESRKKVLESLKVGERRTGKVSSIVNFGAFVDLGGVDGLVHVSELSWRHVEHPGEVATVGEDVEVEVLDIDLERERVSLSLKATQEDPWKEFERKYNAGEIIEGEVTKLVPFGAFVRVADDIEGLVHISELSEAHVETAEEVVNVGARVRVKVVDVDVPRRRISLSMRRVEGEAIITPEFEPKPDEVVPEPAEAPAEADVEPEVEAEVEPEAAVEPEPEAAAEAEVEPEPAEAPAEADVEPEVEAEVEPEAAVEPEVEPEPAEAPAEADVEPEVEAEPASEPTPEPEAAPEEGEAEEPPAPSDDEDEDEATEEGAPDAEMSLEDIVADLKRREGRD